MASLRRKLGFHRMTLAEGHEYWGAKMKRGQMAFILRWGVPLIGGGLAIVYFGLWIFQSEMRSPQAVVLMLLLTLMDGIVGGFCSWFLLRWRFHID
jgi:hypothetical protein